MSEDSDYTSDINIPSNNSPRHSRNGHRDDDEDLRRAVHGAPMQPDYDEYDMMEPYDQGGVSSFFIEL